LLSFSAEILHLTETEILAQMFVIISVMEEISVQTSIEIPKPKVYKEIEVKDMKTKKNEFHSSSFGVDIRPYNTVSDDFCVKVFSVFQEIYNGLPESHVKVVVSLEAPNQRPELVDVGVN
jgi:hypothetical protein